MRGLAILIAALAAALVISGLIGGCTVPRSTFAHPATEPPIVGDPERGQAIFRKGKGDAPPCSSCHALRPGTFTLGPIMQGISSRAGSRTPPTPAEEYLRQSILEPEAFLVPGFRPIMYPKYAEQLTLQDVADLVAYLLTL
jgi:mono/diheme cytochrome c family protein